jgi:hypothetical protein
MDVEYEEHTRATMDWPTPLPDRKPIYRSYYSEMDQISHNIVCSSCGTLGHDIRKYIFTSPTKELFKPLSVEPSLVPFPFQCGILDLDQIGVMIDPLSIGPHSHDKVAVCRSCHSDLSKGKRPIQALANSRWIGPVPDELKNLTWAETALIARSHIFGRVFRMEERKGRHDAYGSVKGHIILVPQNTLRLLDVLPMSPDSLADMMHVVWVGKSEPDLSKIRPQFSVERNKVLIALTWLKEHHEDYRNITIDNNEIDKWPSVFVTDSLLNTIGRVRNGTIEDASRNGFATEDVDNEDFQGDIPNLISAVLDVNDTAKPRHLIMLKKLEELSKEVDKNLTINVITASDILQPHENPAYFTSSFPTLFPWGTGKHRNSGGKPILSLKKWTQLLLQDSSRYYLLLHPNC